MSDTYQAVYDAVRSKISGGNIGDAVAEVARQHLDVSYAIEGLKHDAYMTMAEYRRPSAVYRPRISIDGDQWCALYGENLQDGVAGFGKSPELAMQDFDVSWLAELGKRRMK